MGNKAHSVSINNSRLIEDKARLLETDSDVDHCDVATFYFNG